MSWQLAAWLMLGGSTLLLFLVVAIVAAALGFGGIAGTAAWSASIAIFKSYKPWNATCEATMAGTGVSMSAVVTDWRTSPP